MDKLISTLRIGSDGFLWYGGMKLQCKYVPGRGLEFHEKDPRRAAAAGGPLFVVPYEAILELFGVGVVEEGKEGERG